MAVTLTGSGGLFTILGKIFHAQATLNTARGTTVPAEVQDAITAYEALADTLDNLEISEGLAASTANWQNNDSLMIGLSQFAERLVVQLVDADANLNSPDIQSALLELIDQMEGSGGESNPDDDVDASAAGITVNVGGSNVTDGVVVATVTNGDGRNTQHALGETISVAVQSTDGNGSLTFIGQGSAPSRLSHEWPSGSASSTTISGVSSAGSLLNNGDFDDEDDRDNTPDDWIVDVGTIGTTVKMTNSEVQTVAISGTPTSGTYTLTYTDGSSNVYTTAPLAYNASGTSVQSALRGLAGLELVAVSTSGTTPNVTHTITFAGVAGNVAALSNVDTFDTGSVGHAEITAGSASAYNDKAVEFDANGSELTAIKQLLEDLSPRTVYALHCRILVDTFPAAGAIKIDLVNGAGSAITDTQGGSNVIDVNPQSGGDLTEGAFVAINGFFRTPANIPDAVYLRIRISTAISSGTSVFIDDAALTEATELYPGGPLAAFFAGKTGLSPDDSWTLDVTNDRAGGFQEWFLRNFEFPDILLPSDSGGGETIADSLIA